jgi:hypothetical protein
VGVIGFIETSGHDLLARDGLPEVLGMRFNPFAAGMFLVFGIIALAVTALGRNIDYLGNFWLGHIMVLISLFELAFLRTDLNLLGFNMTSDIVVMTVGLVLLTSGMYAQVGPVRHAAQHAHA